MEKNRPRKNDIGAWPEGGVLEFQATWLYPNVVLGSFRLQESIVRSEYESQGPPAMRAVSPPSRELLRFLTTILFTLLWVNPCASHGMMVAHGFNFRAVTLGRD